MVSSAKQKTSTQALMLSHKCTRTEQSGFNAEQCQRDYTLGDWHRISKKIARVINKKRKTNYRNKRLIRLFPTPIFSYLIRTFYFNEANITFASSPWGRAIQLHSRYGTHSETTALSRHANKDWLFLPTGSFFSRCSHVTDKYPLLNPTVSGGQVS